MHSTRIFAHVPRSLILATAAIILVLGSISASVLAAEQEAKLLPADGGAAGGWFGRSIDLDGDTAIISGDQAGTGSAYVFTRSGGVWTQEAKLLADDADDGDYFGNYVAVDGDTAIIGAWGDADNGALSGSAYVFTRTEGVWTQQAKLLPSDGAAYDIFGNGVAIEGDTAVIGAPWNTDSGNSSGSAYVFVRTGELWTQQAKLLPADGAAFEEFGNGVAIDAETVVISAWHPTDNGISSSGSAYVFTRTGEVWTQQAKLTPGDGAAGDRFGHGIAFDGDTAVVGATADDDHGPNSGSAYVFARTGEAWTQQAKLLPADNAFFDSFGYWVALDGDTTIVGSYGDDDNGEDSGSAYLFTRTGEDWRQQAKLLPSDGAAGDHFSVGVALQGDTAIIGAPSDDDNGEDSGSAYVVALNDCSITVTDAAGDTLIWFAPDSSGFDLVSGYLSELFADSDFFRAECVGTFSTSPAVDTLPGPTTGDARYYLARGLSSCMDEGYGNSSVTPDPRDDLLAAPCP